MTAVFIFGGAMTVATTSRAQDSKTVIKHDDGDKTVIKKRMMTCLETRKLSFTRTVTDVSTLEEVRGWHGPLFFKAHYCA